MREFRVMQRAALAVAEDAGKIDNAVLARRQQFLAREFRRRPQITTVCRSPSGPIRSVAKACRWVSFPGETCNAAVSTSTNSRVGKPCPQSGRDAVARQQIGPAGGMGAGDSRMAELFGTFTSPGQPRERLASREKIAMVRPETAAPSRH